MFEKNFVVRNVDQVIDFIETVVDSNWKIRLRKQTGLQVLQQNRIELGDSMGSPVITLHHAFTGCTPVQNLSFFPEPECLGDRHLQIEQKSVFTSLRLNMQTDPDILERSFLFSQLLCLGSRNQATLRQFVP